MEFLPIMGPPRAPQGATNVLLESFISGAAKAGARVKTVYLNKLNIIPCQGCFYCLDTNNKSCKLDDDFKLIFNDIQKADYLVLATPIYFSNVTGIMKNFIDRLISLQGSGFVYRNNTSKIRYKLFLLAVCGLEDSNVFLPLVNMYKNSNSNFCGYLTRTMSEVLLRSDIKEKLNWYFHAVQQAGYELINTGVISDGVQEILEKDICPRNIYKWVLSNF